MEWTYGAKSVDADLSIMIHIDRGADHPASRNFYVRFLEHGVNFDVIGLEGQSKYMKDS